MVFNGRREKNPVYRVILTELGVAVYDGSSHARSFPFEEPTAGYLAARDGSLDGLGGLAEYLSGLDAVVSVSDAGLLAALKRTDGIDCRAMDAGDAESVQSSKPAILAESGFASDHADAMSRLRDFALALSSSRVAEASGSADMHIIQAIKSLDDVDRMANLLDSRMREWYGLHFPELGNLVDGVAGYAAVVLAGRRDGLAAKDFEDAGFDDAKVQMLATVSERSRGGEISDEDLDAVQGLARQVAGLHDLRRRIEARLEAQMAAAAPNLAVILGATVGARIMARAGSLKRLAMMPASTIQLLGAEKALFRSLRSGSSPPKHGLLFQHPLVHAAPRWQRGKIARAVSAQAAIAARVDLHEPRINETLLEKLNVRVGEIGRKYAGPPAPRLDRGGDGGGERGGPGGPRRPPPRERYGQRRPQRAQSGQGHGGRQDRRPPGPPAARAGGRRGDGAGADRPGAWRRQKRGRGQGYGQGHVYNYGNKNNDDDNNDDDDGSGGSSGGSRGRGGDRGDERRGRGREGRGRGGGSRGGGGAFGRPFGGKARHGAGKGGYGGRRDGHDGGRQGRAYEDGRHDGGRQGRAYEDGRQGRAYEDGRQGRRRGAAGSGAGGGGRGSRQAGYDYGGRTDRRRPGPPRFPGQAPTGQGRGRQPGAGSRGAGAKAGARAKAGSSRARAGPGTGPRRRKRS